MEGMWRTVTGLFVDSVAYVYSNGHDKEGRGDTVAYVAYSLRTTTVKYSNQ